MKTILSLLVVLLAFFALSTPAQAKGKFFPYEQPCIGVYLDVQYYEDNERRVPANLKEKKAICDDYAKNPKKYQQPEQSTKGKTLRQIAGW